MEVGDEVAVGVVTHQTRHASCEMEVDAENTSSVVQGVVGEMDRE